MRITAVEPFVVPYRESNDHDRVRFGCLVRVLTDDGIVGWGEAVTLFEEASRATAALVRGLEEHLVRVEASPAAAGDAMRSRMWWYGNGGIASFAVSAVDMALWDIRARAERVGLLDLLGGPVHDSLPTIVSCHATLADLGQQVELIGRWVADAQAAGVKVGFGKAGEAALGLDAHRDERFVRLLRDALGPDARIMVDIGAALHWTVHEAVERTRLLDAFGIDWIEEPLGADDPEGYARLRAGCRARVAYGEREWTVRGIERIVGTGTVDVVGIDPGRAEGISGFVAAARLVAEQGREANAHAFSGPITYAAALALSLSSSACHQLEVPPHLNQLYDLVGLPTRPVGGRVSAAPGPGLGFEVDERAVRGAAVG